MENRPVGLGGDRPQDVERLTFHGLKMRPAPVAAAAPAERV